MSSELTSSALRAVPTLPVQPWARELVRAYEGQAVRDAKVEACEIGREILKREAEERLEIASAALERLVNIDKERERLGESYSPRFMARHDVLRGLLTRLLRARLPYDEERLVAIVEYWSANRQNLKFTSPGSVFHQIRLLYDYQPVTGPLAAALTRFSETITLPRFAGYAAEREQIEAILALLAGTSAPELAPSPWSSFITADLAGRPGERAARYAIELALTASDKSKPSKAFLRAARTFLEQNPGIEAQLFFWIEAYAPEPGRSDPNEDVIRGLIWLLSAAGGEQVAARLGAYGDFCFKKVKYWGARSPKLGNGVIQALGLIGDGHAVAELTRLRTRVRYPTAVQRIEATLADAAARLGIGACELEEMSVPTYDFSAAGERRMRVGAGEATLRLVDGTDVVLSWSGPRGRETKSPPKDLKEADPQGVKAARLLQKEIRQTLAGQAARLEALYLADRRISLPQWRERYATHPLLARIAGRLIWRFEWDGSFVSGLPRGSAVENVDGQALDLPDRAVVSLWHPLFAATDEVLAWRQRLARLAITQPFRQAHREVYILTDAERQTATYSNRFAAHILRQHQFKALCDQRGWQFQLMGAWDSYNTPTRPLPRHGMSVEYLVDTIDTAQTTGAFVYTLIATDQVRFVRDDVAIPLADVPPMVFSELMRDVDLFVGVASVGNDPDWVDGGPDGRHRDYWQSYAFGDLTQTARNRGEVLSSLLPRLAIADRCRVEGRFLIVRGTRKTYKIHLGSGNVIMEPGGRYLCIVADRESATSKLVLPFEGDGMLSLILSKAFLLAADDRITDRMILSQIR